MNTHPGTFATNEDWCKTARVIQSIVSILTISLISTVCLSAAVIFVQRIVKRLGHFSMRQVVTLAEG